MEKWNRQLKDPDPGLRREAAEELAYADPEDERTIRGLVRAMEDENMGVRDAASYGLQTIAGPMAAACLIPLIGSEDIVIRNLAMDILVNMGADAVDPAIRVLHDEDGDVRKFGADILGMVGDPRGAEPLCKALWDPDQNVAYSAAEALGKIGDSQGIGPLLEAFRSLEHVRTPAAEALGKIGGEEAVEALSDALYEEDVLLVFGAAEALGNLRDPGAFDALIRFVLKTKDPYLRNVALMAASKVSERTGQSLGASIPGEKWETYVMDGLADDEEAVRADFIAELRKFDDEKLLLRLLEGAIGRDEEAGLALITALSEVGKSPETVALLEQALAYPDAETKCAILRGLARIGGTAVLTRLTEALSDPVPEVREEALQALVGIGGSEALEQFIALSSNEDPGLRESAIRGLGMLGTDAATSVLKRALSDESPALRRTAAASLARSGDAQAFSVLSEGLKDSDSEVQMATLDAFREIGTPETVQYVSEVLKNDNPWVAFRAAEILGAIGDEAAVEPLLDVMTRENDLLVIASAKALGALKSRKAIGPLRSLIGNENSDVRQAAEEALEAIG
jgi:HEAT repeat protein